MPPAPLALSRTLRRACNTRLHELTARVDPSRVKVVEKLVTLGDVRIGHGVAQRCGNALRQSGGLAT